MNQDDTPSFESIKKALDVLQLPQWITKEDIKRQYRYLAKRYHPDRGGDATKMAELSRAYDILMQYIERFKYRFDDEEIRRQFPGVDHAQQFKP